MKRAQASAFGKVILLGEHAVVYGRPAIAVPVSGVQAHAEIVAAPTGGFRLVAPDLNRDNILTLLPKTPATPIQNAASEDPLAAIVQSTLNYFEAPPFNATLTVTSTIPLGRGMGSGAAVSTSIVRVIANFLEQTITPDKVSELVYGVEKLYHGTPSGIDNTVVAFEQPVYFIKGRPIQRLAVARPFTLVIGDTGIIASTRAVVGHVRQCWQADPERYEGYFDEVGVLARHARIIIEQEITDISALGKLMNENQELLQTLGVSSPGLERLIDAARQTGALGAKLSGAGWGGNMIALVPAEPGKIAAVVNALQAAGAVGVLVTQIG